jgi:nucleoside-diphosphate-sugar epimerase
MFPFVTIIGAGWLGFPLAKALKEEQCTVFATTTKEEKKDLLSASGMLAAILLFDQNVTLEGFEIPKETEILIITIPPSLGKKGTLEHYKAILSHILNQTGHLIQLKKILFTSSTSVYGNAKGILTEETEIQPQTNQEKVLAEVENLLKQKSQDYAVYILRLGGLVGPGREPANFFKDKKDIPGGEIQVNLVHQKDVIEIIKRIILNDTPQGIYNISADKHPARGIFYPQRSKDKGMDEPTFIWGNEPERYVSNEKVKKITGYTFVYPDPLFFPSSN